ncbi:fumarylacetoacetate hydrolase family protein [Mycetocola sp. 2940]|uniref:fumarylacetoacetate hydrolase family protein n=1 Tax=Mycetocola sp. 2940 TaxID=3156452 RepID=UPI00339699ED
MTDWTGGVAALLPADAERATLVGRAWDPAAGGPSVVAVRDGLVIDLSRHVATMSELTESTVDVATLDGPPLGTLADLLANAPADGRDASNPWLLSPIDLHVVKAAGVTFPVSMLERIIEERALGAADAAESVRAGILGSLGTDLSDLVPGSPEAMLLKDHLIAEGLWSQYLEVGIGPDAEIFTKAPVLATVGTGVDVGVRSDSHWNNPEPEVVLVIASDGRIVGATLGNDVNLRDIEGRSALLLGQAKDNNASAAVGPFLRLFDAGFDLDALRRETITLHVDGADGYALDARSHMEQISRDPADLAAQTLGDRHQYPDGLVLYLGTMFAPSDDRGEAGHGFTHHRDDIVRISSPALGALVNRVRSTEDVEPWVYGIGSLMTNLAERGLLIRQVLA